MIRKIFTLVGVGAMLLVFGSYGVSLITPDRPATPIEFSNELPEVGGVPGGFSVNNGVLLRTKDGNRLPAIQVPESNRIQLAEASHTLTTNPDRFDIFYYEVDGAINVRLYEEPLAVVRREAEEFLTENLGITEEALCTLDASVKTNRFVNSYYGDRELGFSVCPGSVYLD